MKIQHLEALFTSTNSPESLEDEVKESYIILMNALSCLSANERWIAVHKVAKSKTSVMNGNGNGLNHIKKMPKTNHRAVERVALKLNDIQAEYQVYVDRKQLTAAQELNFTGF